MPRCVVNVQITFGTLNASVLVVTQEESFSAAALIAAHHVDTNLLASAIAFWALVHICQEKDTQTHTENEKKNPCMGSVQDGQNSKRIIIL